MGKRSAASLLFVIGLVSVTTGAVSFQQVGSNMVGFWRFEEASGPSLDSSGNNNTSSAWPAGVSVLTGAANVPAALAGKSNRCLSFDGVSGMVSIPSTAALTIPTDFTVAFWMYRENTPADYVRLVGKGAVTIRTFGVWLEANGDRILFQQSTAPNTYTPNCLSLGHIPMTTWTHVACRMTGNTAAIFIDGNASTGTGNTRSALAQTDTAPLTLGYGGIHNYYKGRLDDVRLYNVALSDADIAAIAGGSDGPAAPVLSATTGATSTVLTWTGSATVFNVKRSSTPGGPYTTIASSVAGNTYTDNARGYYYVVSGVTYGEGPNSNEVAPPVTALPNTGLFTSEAPTSAPFVIKFNQAVLAGDTVQVTVTSTNSAEGIVSDGVNSGAQIVYNVLGPQSAGSYYTQITVTGVPDLVADGPQSYDVTVATSCPTNPAFTVPIPPVHVTNNDTDTPGITVSKTAGLITTESGGTDTFSVTLSTAPLSTVTVNLTSSNSAEVVVSPSVINFSAGNYNSQPTVTVTGVDDTLLDFTQPFTIFITVSSSGTDYSGMVAPNPTGVNLDDEAIPPAKGAWGGGGCGLLGLEVLALGLLRRRRR
jgi:hypothetical protein